MNLKEEINALEMIATDAFNVFDDKVMTVGFGITTPLSTADSFDVVNIFINRLSSILPSRHYCYSQPKGEEDFTCTLVFFFPNEPFCTRFGRKKEMAKNLVSEFLKILEEKDIDPESWNQGLSLFTSDKGDREETLRQLMPVVFSSSSTYSLAPSIKVCLDEYPDIRKNVGLLVINVGTNIDPYVTLRFGELLSKYFKKDKHRFVVVPGRGNIFSVLVFAAPDALGELVPCLPMMWDTYIKSVTVQEGPLPFPEPGFKMVDVESVIKDIDDKELSDTSLSTMLLYIASMFNDGI